MKGVLTMLTTFLGLSLVILPHLGCQAELDDGAPPSAKPSAPSAPAPTSRLKTIVWEFGVLAPGKEARHRFTIPNPSTMTWTVKNGSKARACTVGELSSREVKPGASTTLEVVLRAPAREGSVHQSFMVEFAEPQAPLFNLAIEGEARNPVSAIP